MMFCPCMHACRMQWLLQAFGRPCVTAQWTVRSSSELLHVPYRAFQCQVGLQAIAVLVVMQLAKTLIQVDCIWVWQENASKPEGLPPNQGGKYCRLWVRAGAASRRAPAGGHAAGAGGLDDVSHVLSKGFTQACTVAGARLALWLHVSRAPLRQRGHLGAAGVPVYELAVLASCDGQHVTSALALMRDAPTRSTWLHCTCHASRMQCRRPAAIMSSILVH